MGRTTHRKAFIVVFWLPALILAMSWLIYDRMSVRQQPPISPHATVAAKPVSAADLAREQQEMHDNIKAAQALQKRTEQPGAMGHETHAGH